MQVGAWRRKRTEPVEDQIAERLGLVGHLFGLMPWDIDRLLWWQWASYREYADAHLRGADG